MDDDENVSDGGATPRPATRRTRTDDGRVTSYELPSYRVTSYDDGVTSYELRRRSNELPFDTQHATITITFVSGILTYMKNFLDWIRLKEKLHNTTYRPPLVSEGDIWWVSVGENVGSEVNGKSAVFSRPVIILKKLAHGFYFVVPTSTQLREGSWYVHYRHKNKENVACLHQARAIDYRRLSSKLGTMDDADMERVKVGFHTLYK